MSADIATDVPAGPGVPEGPGAAGDGSGGAHSRSSPRSAVSRRAVGPLVAIGLAVVLVVAAVVVAIVGGDDVSATAVRVNATEVSQKTFNHQLRDLASVLLEQGFPGNEVTDAFVPTGASADLAQIYIVTELLDGRVDVSETDREQLLTEGEQQLAQFTPELRDRIVDVTLLQTALVEERGQNGATRFVRRLADDADVYVDPRYGFWSPARAQVCPPTGCVGAATGG